LRPLFYLRTLPDGTVHILVERRTPRRELAQLVVLRPHERGAITERSADALAIELAMLLKLPHEIGLSERRAPDADERRPASAHIGSAGLRQELLQVTVTAADDRQVRKRALDLGGEAKVPGDADQRMLGRLVAIRRRILERPNDVGIRVRIAH